MLFNATITRLQNTCQNIEVQIEDLQRQIEMLREQKLALESHLQQLGSAEAAAESAIEQTRTAISIISAVSEAELQTFKEAINSLFTPAVALLTEAPQEQEAEPEPEPVNNDPDPEIEITVEADNTSEPEQKVENTEEIPIDQRNYKELQQLARDHGINPRQSRKTLAGLIKELLVS
jgi:hypothetical protein